MQSKISEEKYPDEQESILHLRVKSIKNKLSNYSMQTNNNHKVLKKAQRLKNRPIMLHSEERDNVMSLEMLRSHRS